jgi:DNA-binding MarR family transcriptional regulator
MALSSSRSRTAPQGVTRPVARSLARTNRPMATTCAEAVLKVMPGVMDAMRSAMRNQVGSALSVPQFRCLNFIAQRPGCSIGCVAKFLGVSMATASAMVDRLVTAGAVMPSTAAADRRRAELQLTAQGRALLDPIRKGAQQEFAQALGACSDDDLQVVCAGLGVLQRVFVQLT